MAKKEGQKLKILYIKDYLERNSHEKHPVSAAELVHYLEQQGIDCERKSVISDIQALQDYGMDIEVKHGPKGGYYVASGVFQLPEVKLLVDAVQSARFLTRRKSASLIRKLLRFCNRYDETLMSREVLISGRVKSMNESIYYNLDAIQEAISANKQITFRYFDWGVGRKQQFRPGPYIASPYALCQDNENYYLLAHTARHGVTHYRVDRMVNIGLTDQPRNSCPELTGKSLESYGQKVFQMFSGTHVQVKMRFANRLAGVVFDRFGEEAMLIPDGADHFTFTTEVAVSPLFLSWIIGFGTDAVILHPQWVQKECCKLCTSVLEEYLP